MEFGYDNDFKTVELPIESVKKGILFSIEDILFTFAKCYTEKK
ncbi:hypothetical protein OAT18_00315 [Tenacibaculum sp.]|nr:hypothetical protein [Tenacibaculum sp.]